MHSISFSFGVSILYSGRVMISFMPSLDVDGVRYDEIEQEQQQANNLNLIEDRG
jgi:hypothetical protein